MNHRKAAPLVATLDVLGLSLAACSSTQTPAANPGSAAPTTAATSMPSRGSAIVLIDHPGVAGRSNSGPESDTLSSMQRVYIM
jgi:hypothetical protein